MLATCELGGERVDRQWERPEMLMAILPPKHLWLSIAALSSVPVWLSPPRQILLRLRLSGLVSLFNFDEDLGVHCCVFKFSPSFS